MKILSILAAVLALTALPLAAKDMHFPHKGDAMFTITIPDSWEPGKDEEGTLEATSPNEGVYLCIWSLESDKDANDLGKDIVDLLKDHAKDIKIEGDAVEAHPGGLDGALIKGSAKDKEDGKAIGFFALVLSNKKKASVVYIEVGGLLFLARLSRLPF
jgi:hypothetical protein